ncbi:hypothetical protein ACP70R_040250 [Stipagrostis hirtigluma subsp. patula]
MDASVIVLSVVVGLFGVASAVLGFIAEATKLTDNDIVINEGLEECDYPPNSAFVLSLVAVPLLAVGQIIASLAAGCCGCCRPLHGASESKRVVGIIAAVLSWIAALVAGAFYLEGAVWNAPFTRPFAWCKILKDGAFRRAALIGLAATALGIIGYVMLRGRAPAATPSTAPEPAAGATDTRPDVPPAAEAVAVPEPVFPQVPRHPVRAYGQASNPHSHRSPQRQPEAAVEVMMA